jgi:arylformamidase
MPDLAAPTALDRELSPSLVARDAEGTLREYRARSDAARARLRVHEAVPYGDHPAERCHVFPAAGPGTAGTPVLVFVHGGHWQQSGMDEACFAAGNAVARGCAYVALNYGLAPARRLPEMIASVARGLAWLAGAGPRFGIAPGHVHVAGSSAGAHLLAAALATGAPRVRSACLLSGLYDLSVIPGSYVNDALGLTADTARACSPLRLPPPRCDEVLLAAGEHETPEYLRQQAAYAAHLRAAGVAVADRVVAGRDHFDLPLDLDDPTTELGRTGRALRGAAVAGTAGTPERTVTSPS